MPRALRLDSGGPGRRSCQQPAYALLGAGGDNRPLSLVGSDGFPKSSRTTLGPNSRSSKVTDAKAISDQFQTLVVHCHRYRYRRSKHARSQPLDVLEHPGLRIVLPEQSRSARGNRAVAGEANVQCGVWNQDAAILIVSRCRQSEVESSTDYVVGPGPVNTFWSLQGLGSPEPVMLIPGSTWSPGKLRYLFVVSFSSVQKPSSPSLAVHCGGGSGSDGGGEIEGVTVGRTFWLSA